MEIIFLNYKWLHESDGVINVEYRIGNPNMPDICYHCASLPIKVGEEETCLEYMPKARQEIMNILNQKLPNKYI